MSRISILWRGNIIGKLRNGRKFPSEMPEKTEYVHRRCQNYFPSPDCLVRRHPMWLMKFSINSCNSVWEYTARQNSKRKKSSKEERLYCIAAWRDDGFAGCQGANMADWKDDSMGERQKSKRQKGMDSMPYSSIMAV